MSIISKFFDSKKMLSKLIIAFPAELQEDVKIVFSSFPKTMVNNNINCGISIGCERRFFLCNNTIIEMPYRIYFVDSMEQSVYSSLTQTQQNIYHCIFSLSYDGYIREKHLKALLNQDNIRQWVYPFVLKNSSEYVVQILDAIYQCLKSKDNTELKDFCKQNLQVFLYFYFRMISYWNEFYRYDCHQYKDYIGRKLYFDCFGYTRELEKYRKNRKTQP